MTHNSPFSEIGRLVDALAKTLDEQTQSTRDAIAACMTLGTQIAIYEGHPENIRATAKMCRDFAKLLDRMAEQDGNMLQ